MFYASIAAFFAIMIETVVFQQKCVDATKKLNPEKTASVYDTRFQKKWMEAEKNPYGGILKIGGITEKAQTCHTVYKNI
ncbi:MAG: DUF3169 family protein [Ruminococcus sp.]|nr:DUF3169 family protein [Ruminococcus sp.]